jgi:hypothetical protein
VDEDIVEGGSEGGAGAVHVGNRTIQIGLTDSSEVTGKPGAIREREIAAFLERERWPDGELRGHAFESGEPDLFGAEDMREVRKGLWVTPGRGLQSVKDASVGPLHVGEELVEVARHIETCQG